MRHRLSKPLHRAKWSQILHQPRTEGTRKCRSAHPIGPERSSGGCGCLADPPDNPVTPVYQPLSLPIHPPRSTEEHRAMCLLLAMHRCCHIAASASQPHFLGRASIQSYRELCDSTSRLPGSQAPRSCPAGHPTALLHCSRVYANPTSLLHRYGRLYRSAGSGRSLSQPRSRDSGMCRIADPTGQPGSIGGSVLLFVPLNSRCAPRRLPRFVARCRRPGRAKRIRTDLQTGNP